MPTFAFAPTRAGMRSLDASPLQCLLHRLPAGLDTPRFAPRFRRGPRQYTPMVKNQGEVAYVPSLLRGAQSEVVILRPFKTYPHATRPSNKVLRTPPNAAIHIGKQEFRRPIRLELRCKSLALGIHFVIVGIEKIRIGWLLM